MKLRKPRYVKAPKGMRKLTVREARDLLKHNKRTGKLVRPGFITGSKQDTRHAQSIIARRNYERKKKFRKFLQSIGKA